MGEFKEFLFSQNIVRFGALGSTLAALAAATTLANASAKAKSKVTGATRLRDACVNAFSYVFKFAPRVTVPSDRFAEETFGVDVKIPASTTMMLTGSAVPCAFLRPS